MCATVTNRNLANVSCWRHLYVMVVGSQSEKMSVCQFLLHGSDLYYKPKGLLKRGAGLRKESIAAGEHKRAQESLEPAPAAPAPSH